MMRKYLPIVLLLTGSWLLMAAALVDLGMDALVRHWGGAFAYAPEEAEWVLSEQARKLIDQAYAGLEDATIIDHHVHALSLGQRSGAGFDNRSYVNPEFFTWLHPRKRLRSAIYFSAAGIPETRNADAIYMSRIRRQVLAAPGQHRLQLLALDQVFDEQGQPQPQKTAFFVDSDYVEYLAEQSPELFTPVISVHPYRQDAVQMLEKWAERGIRAVKWLPNLQFIDPAAKRIKPYYEALVEHDLTLITHTGSEQGLPGGRADYGDPMRYRQALDLGVRMVMTHAASSGQYPDPDDPDGPAVPGYELFLRLLDNPDYRGQLYGDIAGLTHADRDPGALAAILQHPQHFDRLVYGSDYPLPAVHSVTDLAALADGGFITQQQVAGLESIYQVNPLLFDFVLKRLLRLPHTDLGFPDAVFTRLPRAGD